MLLLNLIHKSMLMVVCADMLLAETAANDRDGKRVTITVYQGSNPDPSRPGVEVQTLTVSSLM